jgi:hypothetical protein
MNADLHAHYEAVLLAEKREREQLCLELRRLNAQLKQKDALIAALAASLVADDAASRALSKPLPFPQPVGLGAAEPPPADPARFENISVRWAILSLMTDYTPDAELRTPTEMAEALIAGGVRTGGANFAANVAAVVSTMKARNELESPGDGKYGLTPHGKDVWQTIKLSSRYQNRRYGLAGRG